MIGVMKRVLMNNTFLNTKQATHFYFITPKGPKNHPKL